jgi:hypothetical protein
MTTASLPHGPYMDVVHAALADEGITPWMWISCPDGSQLDAVFEFADRDVDEDQWPDGVYLGWDQHSGWTMTTTGSSRTQYDLTVHPYGKPQDVAAVVAAQLRGRPVPQVAAGPWPGDTTAAEVEEWDAEHDTD